MMTKRMEVTKAPEPLEEYLEYFDPLFGKSNQCEGLRRYVEGLLLSSERYKTLTGLVNTEPVRASGGSLLATSPKLQWFLSELGWDAQGASRAAQTAQVVFAKPLVLLSCVRRHPTSFFRVQPNLAMARLIET